MPNRPLRRGGRGGFEGGALRQAVPNKPLAVVVLEGGCLGMGLFAFVTLETAENHENDEMLDVP